MADQTIDRRPLSLEERALIQRAADRPWTGLLRAALAVHVSNRGGHVDRYSTCGDMVDWLEMVASDKEQT